MEMGESVTDEKRKARDGLEGIERMAHPHDKVRDIARQTLKEIGDE